MLNYKSNKKGSAAALLTLGLVIIGSLVTIGISYLTTTSKIASNPRAQSCTAADIPESTKACCFCQNGSVRVYATADARLANCMGTACSTEAYGTAYNATSWGYCDSPGGGNYQAKCDRSGDGDDDNLPTEECPIKDYNCNKIKTTYQDHILSKDKKGLYYDGDSCKGDGMAKKDIETEVCVGLNDNECFPYNCNDIDGTWKSKSLLAMGDGEERRYYTDLKKNCTSTAYTEETIASICDPGAAPTCESTTCGDIISNVDPSSANKKIYYMSDDDDKYYKKITSGKCVTEISDINTECPSPPTPLTLTPTPYKVISDSAHEIWKNTDYISCNKDGIKFNSALRDSFIKDCYEGNKEVPNFPGCPYKVMQSDAGWDVVDDYLYCCRLKC